MIALSRICKPPATLFYHSQFLFISFDLLFFILLFSFVLLVLFGFFFLSLGKTKAVIDGSDFFFARIHQQKSWKHINQPLSRALHVFVMLVKRILLLSEGNLYVERI